MLKLSPLRHTWILDLDGTVLKHGGYLSGGDSFLPGAKDFLLGIPKDDMIIFLTSRTPEYKDSTERFLAEQGVRYDHIICGAPFGERVLVNDRKPSGLDTAVAVNVTRDAAFELGYTIDAGI